MSIEPARYNVLIVDADGVEGGIEAAAAALSGVFGLPDGVASQVVASLPAVVLKAQPSDIAEAYAERLGAVGFSTRVREAQAQARTGQSTGSMRAVTATGATQAVGDVPVDAGAFDNAPLSGIRKRSATGVHSSVRPAGATGEVPAVRNGSRPAAPSGAVTAVAGAEPGRAPRASATMYEPGDTIPDLGDPVGAPAPETAPAGAAGPVRAAVDPRAETELAAAPPPVRLTSVASAPAPDGDRTEMLAPQPLGGMSLDELAADLPPLDASVPPGPTDPSPAPLRAAPAFVLDGSSTPNGAPAPAPPMPAPGGAARDTAGDDGLPVHGGAGARASVYDELAAMGDSGIGYTGGAMPFDPGSAPAFKRPEAPVEDDDGSPEFASREPPSARRGATTSAVVIANEVPPAEPVPARATERSGDRAAIRAHSGGFDRVPSNGAGVATLRETGSRAAAGHEGGAGRGQRRPTIPIELKADPDAPPLKAIFETAQASAPSRLEDELRDVSHMYAGESPDRHTVRNPHAAMSGAHRAVGDRAPRGRSGSSGTTLKVLVAVLVAVVIGVVARAAYIRASPEFVFANASRFYSVSWEQADREVERGCAAAVGGDLLCRLSPAFYYAVFPGLERSGAELASNRCYLNLSDDGQHAEESLNCTIETTGNTGRRYVLSYSTWRDCDASLVEAADGASIACTVDVETRATRDGENLVDRSTSEAVEYRRLRRRESFSTEAGYVDAIEFEVLRRQQMPMQAHYAPSLGFFVSEAQIGRPPRLRLTYLREPGRESGVSAWR